MTANLQLLTTTPETLIRKKCKYLHVHCSLIYNLLDWEGAQVSTSRWVDKTTIGHLRNGILLGLKKKKILSFLTAWMHLENIILSEISQSEKDKYHMISPICGIKWTNWTNKQNRDRLIEKKQADNSWEGCLEGGRVEKKGKIIHGK